jgi:hypothetical protein
MRCSRIERLLAGYVDGSLGEAEAHVVGNHLESCPACRQATEEARLAHQALRALPPVRAPASFAPRVKAALRAQAARAQAQPWPSLDLGTLLPSAALALITIGTLGWFWTAPRSEYVAPLSVARPRRHIPAARTPAAMAAERRAVMAPGPAAPRVALRRAEHGHSRMALAGRAKPLGDLEGLMAMATGPAIPTPKAAAVHAPAARGAAHVVALIRRADPPLSATEARLPEPAGGPANALSEYAAALASPEARLDIAKVATVASDGAATPPALALAASTGGVSLRSLTTDTSLDWPSL